MKFRTFRIVGHQVSIYRNMFRFILRVYDKRGYVHLVISTLRDRREFYWKEDRKYFNGDWKYAGPEGIITMRIFRFFIRIRHIEYFFIRRWWGKRIIPGFVCLDLGAITIGYHRTER